MADNLFGQKRRRSTGNSSLYRSTIKGGCCICSADGREDGPYRYIKPHGWFCKSCTSCFFDWKKGLFRNWRKNKSAGVPSSQLEKDRGIVT